MGAVFNAYVEEDVDHPLLASKAWSVANEANECVEDSKVKIEDVYLSGVTHFVYKSLSKLWKLINYILVSKGVKSVGEGR